MNRSVWYPAYIGIGSNIGEPAQQVSKAVEALAKVPDTVLVTVSKSVSNAAVGVTDQPDFVNAVAALLTMLSAEELLSNLQLIEQQQGRVRTGERWGPRTLDLDLLVYSDCQISSPTLVVPHERLAQRSFVLGPLFEVAPNLHVPGHGYVSKLSQQVDLSVLSPVTH